MPKTCRHCAKLKGLNFLQDHYNHFRDAGGDHAMYAVWNDLSDKIAAELRQNYNSTHPPIPATKVAKFQKQLEKENAEAALRDDLAWLTGTGRYGQ